MSIFFWRRAKPAEVIQRWSPPTLTALEWAKCIDLKGGHAHLRSVIENSAWLSTSTEQISFLECLQRARDVDKWLRGPR